MKLASAVSDLDDMESALDQCVESVMEGIGDLEVHLVAVFLSEHFSMAYGELSNMIRSRMGSVRIFGCSAGGVIGGGREVEHRPGLSVTVANMPGVEMTPFHLEDSDLPDLDAAPDEWEKALKVPSEVDPKFLLLADPFSFASGNLLLGMDYAYPNSVKIGGLASGGRTQGDNALFLGDEVFRSGVIGVALSGNVVVDTIVAQGCRPVGSLMSVTKSDKNILRELDERPPLEVVREMFQSASQRDQELMQTSLFLGILMDDFVDNPQHGDFLVRNIIGMDGRTGAMAIGELLHEGQRVQFHLRDAITSSEDLANLLNRYDAGSRSEGALLFSCLGRGEHLYGQPDHDTNMFRDKLGPLPLGGFFCNGEIGPVSGSTFLHGYTSSFGIFRPLDGP